MSATINEPASAPRGSNELDADIAEYWDLWSAQIGHALMPRLERLVEVVPSTTSVMICTGDGFNVCSLGIDEEQSTRLAAMVSSVYSISTAATTCLDQEHAQDEPRQLSLQSGAHRTVVTAVPELIIGKLLVWISATDASLGLLMVEAQAIASDIHELLGEDA